MKKTILMLTIVSLLIAVPAMAKKDKGDVDQILWADVDPVKIIDAEGDDPEMVKFDWKDEIEAEKYSLDIEGAGWVTIEGEDDAIWVEFEVSYSAVISELTMPVEDVLADLTEAVLAELEEGMVATGGELVEIIAKVKGLDPQDKEDVKSQDNMFSADLDLLELF